MVLMLRSLGVVLRLGGWVVWESGGGGGNCGGAGGARIDVVVISQT